MKVIKYRRAVATSNNKEKWPKCSFCGSEQRSMNYTEGKKLVCNSCIEKDGEIEYIEEDK